MSTYFAILTEVGEAKLANAIALGQTLKLKSLAVGDGNGNLPMPVRTQKALVHEVRRAGLNQLTIDPANASQIIVEQVLPEDVGGWWIREIGIYDEAGDLCAVANCPPSYKPLMTEGSGRTQVVRIVLIVASTAAIELKIDPSIILATRKYVDDQDIVVRAYSDEQLAEHLAALDPHPQYSMKEVAPLPKFSASRKLVSAEFVQQAQGSMVKYVAVSASRTLMADDMGAALYFTVGGLTLTIPSPDSLGIPFNSGKYFKLFGLNQATGTISSGMNVVIGYDVGDVKNIVIKQGQFITLMATSGQVWQVIDSTAEMRRNVDFADYFNNLAPTQAKFTANNKIATTDFVQQQLGSVAGFGGITASRMTTADDIGKVLWFQNVGFALTLARPVDLIRNGPVLGRCIKLFAFGGISGTIVPASGVTLAFDTTPVATITIKTGQALTLLAVGDATWQVIDSTAEMWRNADFANYFNNVTTTQPQFDNDDSVASTAFVQRALGNKSRTIGIPASTTLTPDSAGCVFIFNGNNVAAVLPLSSTVPSGAEISFMSSNASGCSIARQGTDKLVNGNSNFLTSMALAVGDTATFVCSKNEGWYLRDGSLSLAYSARFGAALVTEGFQKLPSGKIEQWGQVYSDASGTAIVAFPIAFPTAAHFVVPLEINSGAGYATAMQITPGSFRINFWNAAGVPAPAGVLANWFALGS